MPVKLTRGNVLDAHHADAFGHCIGKDAALSAGVAVQFEQQFRHAPQLRTLNIPVGGCAVLRSPIDGRFVYHLVTKPSSYGKPLLPDFVSSVRSMRFHAERHGIRRIVVPRIGCGLDHLCWHTQVKPALLDIFGSSPVTLEIFSLY